MSQKHAVHTATAPESAPPVEPARRLLDHLARAGYRRTATRRAVVVALVTAGRHVTGDELLELARSSLPAVNRATVYRALDALTGLGVVAAVGGSSGPRRFAVVDTGHHHLICTRCETVQEFEACTLESIWPGLSARYGFSMQGHLMEIFGTCRSCTETRLEEAA